MAPNDFNWQIIDSIETLIDRSGMTRAEVIKRSGMRRNTFFVKMRGETALNTDDISKLASALGVKPSDIVIAAAAPKLHAVDVSTEDDDYEVTPISPDLDRLPTAAKKGKKKADEPHAE